MWPYRHPAAHQQPRNTTPNDQSKQPSPYPYNPAPHPSAFQPPTAHHILSLPTHTHPGFGQYSTSNPFTHPSSPKATDPKPLLPTPSAFFTPSCYHDHTHTHPSDNPSAVRAATPQPHLSFRPAFGVSGFQPAAPHELAHKPFESSQPQSGGIQNRPFGYQPVPAFARTLWGEESRFHPRQVMMAQEGKGLGLPSEKVRRELEGVPEEEEGRQGKKRKRSLLPSERVWKRLEGLGPREAWDPDSP